MIVYPVITAAVLAALTVAMGAQYRVRRRPQQLVWAVALAWGLVASLAFLISDGAGGVPWLFRVYYLGGAVLIAPLLGLGSTLLLPHRAWAWAMGAVTAVCAVAAAAGLALAPLDRAALAGLGIAPGTDVVHGALVLVPVIVGNSLGTVAVIGVALWSLARSAAGAVRWGVTLGNALIALGTLVIAGAGSMARLGAGAGFWGTMAAGWVVLYGGVAAMAYRPSAEKQGRAAV